jgi:hypothetical protein
MPVYFLINQETIMGLNTRFEVPDAITSAVYTITWTANEPTAGNAATIADGDTPTVAESGQAIADLTAIVNELVADVTALRANLNAGE